MGFHMTLNYIANLEGTKEVKEVKSMICEKSVYHAMVCLAATEHY